MKKIALLLPVALLLTALPCAAQGPLVPPGAPAPTMKTLEQIEPRTPISSLPCTITNSGSYYVISNLHSTGHGIVIETSGVSVDLMGFSITGDGGSGDSGIHVDGAPNAAIEELVIKGGRISGFFYGLHCQYMNNSRIEQMVVSGNTNVGVYLHGDNGGQCNGNTIADCTISGNAGSGVYLHGENGQCNGNTIANCTSSDNDGFGVYLNGESNGKCDGNTIRGNTVSKNAARGISLYYAQGNRVAANHVWGTTGAPDYGIRTVNTTDNFILKNTCVGHTHNFDLDSDDTYGPIVTNSGALPTSGAAAHPWANFSRGEP
jgi:parallel beta-helix repeat protein